MKNAILVLGAAALLAACTTEGTTTSTTSTASDAPARSFSALPENIVEIAAPGQDLSTAVMQADNCFWYRHEGPVESTMLPLRSRDGRPICAQIESPA